MQEIKNKILISKDKLIKKIIQLEHKLKNVDEKNDILQELSNHYKSDFFVVNSKNKISFISDGMTYLLGMNKKDILEIDVSEIENIKNLNKDNFEIIKPQTEGLGTTYSIYILKSVNVSNDLLKHLPDLMDIMPGGLIYVNSKSEILNINDVAAKLIGINNYHTENKIVTNTYLFKNKTILEDYKCCLTKGEVTKNKKAIITQENTNIFLEYSMISVVNQNNDITGVIISLKDKSNELVRQEELIRILTALDNTRVAIITTDHDYNLSYVNNTAVNLWRYANNSDMIEGQTIKNLLDEKSISKLLKHWNRMVSDRIYYFSDEMTAKRKDGSTFPVEVKATMITDTNGKAVGISMSVNDITEQIAARNELVKAKEMAEESDRLKSAFLANMSHEIRTPMNGIIGFSNLLKRKNLSEEIRDKYIDLINVNGETLIKIIDDIIDLAKIESGQLKIIENECNINNLLNELYIFFIKQLKKNNKNNLSLILSYTDQKNITILIDTLRLKQVFLNLIENAIKFTNEGRIEFGYKIEEEKQILFYVSDSGIGIPYEKQQMIFDRFLQLDNSPSREYGGTGLGLTISKNLVEMMGGKIWVESKPGEGSCFKFILPVKKIDSIKKESRGQVEIEEINVDWHKKQILIAEDEENNYFLLEEFLKETGATLLWAKEGFESLELFKNNNIDLVLLDIKIPNLSGYKVVKEMKKINPKIPVIAQTAYALTGDKEKILEAGCDDYIAKPINHEGIIAIINKYLGSEGGN